MRDWANYAMVVLWLCYGYPMVTAGKRRVNGGDEGVN